MKGIEFACPFCGAIVVVPEPPDPRQPIMHGMPPCERFVDLPVEKYLAACNDALLGKEEADRRRRDFDGRDN